MRQSFIAQAINPTQLVTRFPHMGQKAGAGFCVLNGYNSSGETPVLCCMAR